MRERSGAGRRPGTGGVGENVENTCHDGGERHANVLSRLDSRGHLLQGGQQNAVRQTRRERIVLFGWPRLGEMRRSRAFELEPILDEIERERTVDEGRPSDAHEHEPGERALYSLHGLRSYARSREARAGGELAVGKKTAGGATSGLLMVPSLSPVFGKYSPSRVGASRAGTRGPRRALSRVGGVGAPSDRQAERAA